MSNVFHIRKSDSELDDTLDEFIDNIDFERIHRVMVFLDWKWRDDLESPSIEVLKQTVRGYMKQVAACALEKIESKPGKKKASYEMSTGGFWYRAWVYRGDPKIYFDVKFAIADWNNFQ